MSQRSRRSRKILPKPHAGSSSRVPPRPLHFGLQHAQIPLCARWNKCARKGRNHCPLVVARAVEQTSSSLSVRTRSSDVWCEGGFDVRIAVSSLSVSAPLELSPKRLLISTHSRLAATAA